MKLREENSAAVFFISTHPENTFVSIEREES